MVVMAYSRQETMTRNFERYCHIWCGRILCFCQRPIYYLKITYNEYKDITFFPNAYCDSGSETLDALN